MTSRIDFSSVWAKVSRAEEHIRDLEDAIVAWRDSNSYRITRKANAEFTEQSFIISVLKQSDFQRLSLFTGDAIHDLRSALDHLVYAIAVFRTGQNPLPNPRDLNFPIPWRCAFVSKSNVRRS